MGSAKTGGEKGGLDMEPAWVKERYKAKDSKQLAASGNSVREKQRAPRAHCA